MISSEYPAVTAARIILCVLLPFVLGAPIRWAIVAWLIMGNCDATGPSFAVSETVGWMNVAKGIVLPLWLWWRLRRVPSDIVSSIPSKLWIALTLYAATAGLWSPFPLASLKMVGNMGGTLLGFVVLEKAARTSLLNKNALAVLILVSLGIGVLQTYYFGGEVFGFDGEFRSSRFSGFIWTQQYAAYLVGFLAIVLWHKEFRSKSRAALLVLLTAALVLNGSRTWFLGVTLMAVVWVWAASRRAIAATAFCTAAAALAGLLYINLSPTPQVEDTSSRIIATLNALVTGEDTSRNVGLANLNFRLEIYRSALDEIIEGSALQWMFGHGTSSGATVVMRVFPNSYKLEHIDPNRVMHNEWLRALYEWGIFGLGLLLAVIITLVVGLRRHDRDYPNKIGRTAVMTFLPAFFLAFSTENVLAGAGSAISMSLALVVALLWDPATARVWAGRMPSVARKLSLLERERIA